MILRVEWVALTLLDNRLDVFVHVVVNVLATNDRGSFSGTIALDAGRGVAVLSLLGGQALLHLGRVVMLE